MSDYTKTTNFTAKDALSTGDPNKLIKGSLFDTEFDAIAVANATKYDSGDLASQVQAEGLALNTVLMTPLRVANVLNENGGMLGDIQALADPGNDTLLGWDDSASAAIGFTLGAGLSFGDGVVDLASAVAGAGMTMTSQVLNVIGGDGITANANDIALTASAATTTKAISIAAGVIDLDVSALTDMDFTAVAGGDEFLMEDGGVQKALRWQDFGIPQTDDATTTPFSALAITDANRWYNCNNAGAITATIPANATIAFPVGTTFALHQRGAGQITLAVTTDTLRAPNGAKTANQYSTIFVTKIASTEWVVTGDSTA